MNTKEVGKNKPTITNIKPLTTNLNKPKVKIFNGKANKFTIGRIIEFTILNTIATKIADQKSATYTFGSSIHEIAIKPNASIRVANKKRLIIKNHANFLPHQDYLLNLSHSHIHYIHPDHSHQMMLFHGRHLGRFYQQAYALHLLV